MLYPLRAMLLFYQTRDSSTPFEGSKDGTQSVPLGAYTLITLSVWSESGDQCLEEMDQSGCEHQFTPVQPFNRPFWR